MTQENQDSPVQFYIVKSGSRLSVTDLCVKTAHLTQMFLTEYNTLKRSMTLPKSGRSLLRTEITDKWFSENCNRAVLKCAPKVFDKIANEFDVFSLTDILLTWPIKKDKVPKIISNLKTLTRPKSLPKK